MVETVNAWQCVGCGRLESPQPCIGVCKDQRVTLVYADDYRTAMARIEQERATAAALRTIVRWLAATTPREGEWQASYLALQVAARKALALDRLKLETAPESLPVTP